MPRHLTLTLTLTLAAGLLFSLAASAQPVTVGWTAPTVTARPGQTITATVSLAGGAPTSVAGLQWSTTAPAGWTLTWSAGAAATAAGKQLQASATTLLLVGLNQNAIQAGVVASLAIAIPPNAPAGAAKVSLTGVLAGSGQAIALNATAAPAELTVTVLGREDIDGNGTVTSSDFALASDAALGRSACTNADVNSDGKCDLIDVLAVIRAILGVVL